MKYKKRKEFKRKYIKISPWWKFIRQEFQLNYNHLYYTDIEGYEYEDDKVSINESGLICIKAGFKWGASGPTIDTESSRRASCCHDAGYYLSQKGVFIGPNSQNVKDYFDMDLRDIAIDDSMWEFRAKRWFDGVQLAGNLSWES